MLDNAALDCFVINGISWIQRNGTVWVSVTSNRNKANGVMVDTHCPFDYCKTETLNVTLSDPDVQCAFNHVGTLCGRGVHLISA